MARTIDLEERKQFRVLLNPVRQDIIHLLRRAGRPMTANTVAEKMLLSPSAAQSHLNKLEELGVVELGVYTAPDGRQATYYRLADVEIRLCLGRKDGFQGEREALALCIKSGLTSLLEELANKGGCSPVDIDTLVLTGNTAMLYFFTGRVPVRRAPSQTGGAGGAAGTD